MHQGLVVYKLWVLCVCTWRLWYTSMQPVWLLWHLRGNACGKQASGPVWCHRVLVVDKLAAWLGHAPYASVAAYCSRQLTCVCDRVVAGQQDLYVEPGCVLQWQWSKVREPHISAWGVAQLCGCSLAGEVFAAVKALDETRDDEFVQVFVPLRRLVMCVDAFRMAGACCLPGV